MQRPLVANYLPKRDSIVNSGIISVTANVCALNRAERPSISRAREGKEKKNRGSYS